MLKRCGNKNVKPEKQQVNKMFITKRYVKNDSYEFEVKKISFSFQSSYSETNTYKKSILNYSFLEIFLLHFYIVSLFYGK